jgi:hypothetical protein
LERCYSRRHGVRGYCYLRTAEERLVETLTNWQRKQWAKAGYPRDVEALRRFSRLQQDGTEVYAGEVLPPRPQSSR